MRKLMRKKRQDLGKKITEIRENFDITQCELARRSGLTASAISQMEKGQREPSITSLEKIANGLGIGLTDIIGIPSL
jgi:HTH-type transcriptional repressor of puuD